MVTARIVTYDPVTGTHHLADEHAACLTRGGALGNMAVYAQYVALMGMMHDKVIACFDTGEGFAYGEYPCFHQMMAEDNAQTVTAHLFDVILPLIEGIEDRLEAGIDVLDAGCERGSALLAMAKRFPRSRFTGYDLGEDACAFANAAARAAKLTNIHFEVRDLSGFADRSRFDLITSFDAVHDQKDPLVLVHSLFAALKPGGVYLMQDIGGSAKLEDNIDFPMASLLNAVSCDLCVPVSLGQGAAGLARCGAGKPPTPCCARRVWHHRTPCSGA